MSSINSNKTVYVDTKYGSSKGELDSPALPFRTINQAVNAIPLGKSYLINVAPGTYREDVILRSNQRLSGSGIHKTLIVGRVAVIGNGKNQISQLSIENKNTPPVRVSLSSGSVLFNTVRLIHKIEKSSSSMNSVKLTRVGDNSPNVTFLNTSLTVDVDPSFSGSLRLFNSIGIDTNMTNVSVEAFLSQTQNPATLIYNEKCTTVIKGGSFSINSDVINLICYETVDGSLLSQSNNLRVIPQQSKSNKFIFTKNTNSEVKISHSVIVAPFDVKQQIAAITHEKGNTKLTSVIFAETSVPRTQGENIKIVAHSSKGSVVSTAANYNDIKDISGIYNLTGEESTLLPTSGTKIQTNTLKDQYKKGHTVNIKNNSQESAIIDKVQTSLGNPSYNVKPGQSATIQHNGNQYVLTSAEQSSAISLNGPYVAVSAFENQPTLFEITSIQNGLTVFIPEQFVNGIGAIQIYSSQYVYYGYLVVIESEEGVFKTIRLNLYDMSSQSIIATGIIQNYGTFFGFSVQSIESGGQYIYCGVNTSDGTNIIYVFNYTGSSTINYISYQVPFVPRVIASSQNYIVSCDQKSQVYYFILNPTSESSNITPISTNNVPFQIVQSMISPNVFYVSYSNSSIQQFTYDPSNVVSQINPGPSNTYASSGQYISVSVINGTEYLFATSSAGSVSQINTSNGMIGSYGNIPSGSVSQISSTADTVFLLVSSSPANTIVYQSTGSPVTYFKLPGIYTNPNVISAGTLNFNT